MITLQYAAQHHTLYRVKTKFGACAGVFVHEGIITQSAPIFKKFRGQPLSNLRGWSQVTEVKEID